MGRSPDDCLVVIQISSRRVSATVAWRGDDQEQVVAHRAIECDWQRLGEKGRRLAVADALAMACESAGVEVLSVFVSMADPSLAANFATGYADFGQEKTFTAYERELSLARATHQAIGTSREALHALPQRWTVRSADGGEREVADPVGERGSRLTCHVLLVTAARDTRSEIEHLLEGCDVYLEGMIAQPVALYRGLASRLAKRGSTVVVDCGARFTSIMVHRKERLVHIETHPFGGDDLTTRIATELGIERDQAEALKREVDLSVHAGADEVSGQTFLWREVQERQRQLGPAARICNEALVEFFTGRAKALREFGLLAQHGKVHLTGRAAALGGLTGVLRQIFGLQVVLGTSGQDREASAELGDLMTVGLVRQAALERRQRLATSGQSGVRAVSRATTGVFAWLFAKLS